MSPTGVVSTSRSANCFNPYVPELLEKKNEGDIKYLPDKPKDLTRYREFSALQPFEGTAIGCGQAVDDQGKSSFVVRLIRRSISKENKTFTYIEFAINVFRIVMNMELNIRTLLHTRKKAIVYETEKLCIYVKEADQTTDYLLYFQNAEVMIAVNVIELFHISFYKQKIINEYDYGRFFKNGSNIHNDVRGTWKLRVARMQCATAIASKRRKEEKYYHGLATLEDTGEKDEQRIGIEVLEEKSKEDLHVDPEEEDRGKPKRKKLRA